MKTVYRVSWEIWVKNGYHAENSCFEQQEAFFETKSDAELFKSSLEISYGKLGFKQPLWPSIKVVEVK